MKAFIALAFLSFSVSSFADTAKLVEKCRQAGEEKVMAQAASLNVKLVEEVRECGVDNRPLNPSKYVWFCAKADRGDEIKVLTQKPLFGKCF